MKVSVVPAVSIGFVMGLLVANSLWVSDIFSRTALIAAACVLGIISLIAITEDQ